MKIAEGENSESKYMNKYSSFISFSDIDEKLSASSRDSLQPNKHQENKTDPGQNRSAYYDCEICKKNEVSNYRFTTKKKFEDHMKSKHTER